MEEVKKISNQTIEIATKQVVNIEEVSKERNMIVGMLEREKQQYDLMTNNYNTVRANRLARVASLDNILAQATKVGVIDTVTEMKETPVIDNEA